jgi:small conductance mechanosensitive channel
MPLSFNEQVWRNVATQVLLYVPQVLAAIGLLVAFWLLAAGLDRLVRRFGSVRLVQSDALFIITRSIKISLLLVGVVTALGTLGVNVAAMVAGLGLTGFAVGFALKDIISNALAGVLILFYQPFRRTDRISVFSNISLEGEVVHIDLRYTTLELPDRRILIPNSYLFTNPITIHRAPAPPEQPSSEPAAPKL